MERENNYACGSTALVVGGGTAGLTLALGLRRKGWQVELLERSPQLRETGAGYMLSAAAVHCLRRLGFEAELQACGGPIQQFEYLLWNGERRAVVPRPSQHDCRPVVIDRRDLQGMLVRAVVGAGVRVTLDRCFERMWTKGSRIVAEFEGGRSYEGDVLVGADGIHSRVRKHLWGEETYRYSGYYNFRGLSPVTVGEPGTVSFTAGHDCHIVSCVLPSRMTLWSLFINDTTRTHESWKISYDERERERIGQLISDCGAPVRAAIAAAESFFGSAIYDREPRARWSTDEFARVTLIGDAAHPTTPHMGQGASMAIEDGFRLAELLAENQQDPAIGLSSYEAERLGPTSRVVLMSGVLGGVFQSNSMAPREKVDRVVELLTQAQGAKR